MRLLLQDTDLAKCGRFRTKRNKERLLLPSASLITFSILASCYYTFFQIPRCLVVVYLGDVILLYVTNLFFYQLPSLGYAQRSLKVYVLYPATLYSVTILFQRCHLCSVSSV